MDLKDQLEALSKKIELYKERVVNEEMTKTAFILPFFEMLGYDTRNPFEFHPEFTADIADAKGEKVDYAILMNDIPSILIEAKDCRDNLEKHDKQLMRYFHATEAKLAILTNGIIYKFFTDLEEPNKMDAKPFLEIDLLNIKEHEVNELKKYFKNNFDINNILNSAEELKYTNSIKKTLKSDFENPSENFSNYILNEIYDGVKTQKVKDKFNGIIKKSLNEFISDIVRSKLEGALESHENLNSSLLAEEKEVLTEETKKSNIETTQEELEGLGIIKSIIREIGIDTRRITFKDTSNYFGVLLDGNTRKWICRLYFNSDNKYISVPEYGENGERTNKEIKSLLENKLDDIFLHKDIILQVAKSYL